MAIDKKIFDTLETGAKNQIVSAFSQWNKAEAERLYQSFLPKQPTQTVSSPTWTPWIIDTNKATRETTPTTMKPLETTATTTPVKITPEQFSQWFRVDQNTNTIIPPTTQTPTPAPTTPTQPAPLPTEPTKPTTQPTTTEAKPTTTPTTDFKNINTVEEWKTQTWWWLNNLESWVESKYWTVATQQWNKLVADINWERFEWNIDAQWNPIKTSLWKVADIKTPEQKEELTKQNVLTSFNELLSTFPTEKEIVDFYKRNGKYTEDLKASLRTYFKTKDNSDYFKKYSNLTPEQLFNEYKNWNVIVWSEKYNLLPDELRKEFEEYKTLSEQKLTWEAFSFTDMNWKITSFDDIYSKVKDLFSVDYRKEYEDKMNAPEISQMKTDMTSKADEIWKLDTTIKNLEDDLRAKYIWITEWRLQALLRRDSKELYRKRDDLVASYNVLAQSYSMEKEEIKYWLELARYEDEANKEAFTTAMNLYQTERERMDVIEQREFEAKQAELSYQRQIEWQKEIILFNEEINKTKWWEYIDDWKGNLSYVKDWVVISTLKWLWKTISASYDDLYDYQIKENPDGSYSAFTIDKKTNKITQQVFDINWNIAWGYLATLWNWTITSYGWIHDWWKWLDIDWKVWDPVFAPMWWKVIEVKNYWDKAFGMSVVVELEDWNKIRYSHLSKFWVKVWDTVWKWDIIWAIGKSWYVVPWKGWDWSHLDIQVSWMNAYQVEQYLKWLWKAKPTTWISESVENWGQNILKWKAKLSDITSEMLKTNPTLKTDVSNYISKNKPIYTESDPIVSSVNNNINTLSKIVDWKDWWFFDTDNESLAEDVSGWFQFSPWDTLTWKKQQFLRKIQSVLDSQTLKNLIDVKAQWATFWSLTEKEINILQNASWMLNSAANRDEKWNITWFTMDEEDFKKELARTLDSYKKLKNSLLWDAKNIWDNL